MPKTRRRGARLEMTSLMDVMFLVLVFFIYCIFDMAVHKGLKVDLPNAAGADERGERVVLTIGPDDALQLNGEAVTRAAALAKVKGLDLRRTFRLRRRHVRHGLVRRGRARGLNRRHLVFRLGERQLDAREVKLRAHIRHARMLDVERQRRRERRVEQDRQENGDAESHGLPLTWKLTFSTPAAFSSASSSMPTPSDDLRSPEISTGSFMSAA